MGSYSTRLFAMPSTVSGFARTLDIGATFNGFNQNATGSQADAAAIRADWNAVGEDLMDAAHTWAREQGVE